MNILNHKKIATEIVKNFYAKKNKFSQWQVTDYDNLTNLVMINAHSIYRVFKDDFLIKSNKNGISRSFLTYKKAEDVWLK